MENKYLKELMARNKACACPSLEALFEKKRIASQRESICSYLDSQVDLQHPVPEDKGFLEYLSQAKRDFRASVLRYNRAIRDLSSQGRITFFVYNENKGPVKEVTYSDAYISSQERGLAVTAHCSSCDNQFDVLSRE